MFQKHVQNRSTTLKRLILHEYNSNAKPKLKFPIFYAVGALATGYLLYKQYKHWQSCIQPTQLLRYGDNPTINDILTLCPTLTTCPFKPTFFLTNPHAQTVFNAIGRKTVSDSKLSKIRKCYTFEDGTSVYLDWIDPTNLSTETTEFLTAISIANPFSLAKATKNLQKSWLYRELYDKTFMPRRKLLFARNIDVFVPLKMEQTNETVETVKQQLLEELKHCKSTREMDEKFTFPLFLHNYGGICKTVDDFYDRESCMRWIDHITIPTFCINANDDPVSPSAEMIPRLYDKVTASKNDNIVFAVTQTGGHSAWIDGIVPYSGATWIEHVVLELVEASLSYYNRRLQ